MEQIIRGDIYYADLSGWRGAEQGTDQGDFRPVLVVQNDVGNKYSPTTQIAPLTSKTTKRSLPTHVRFDRGIGGLREPSTVLMEQLRTIDKSRLKYYVGHIDNNKMYEVDCAIATSLFPFNVASAFSQMLANAIPA
ncbi:MAG: type II toxin-antitoxin system PemK/MazF family toxin [Oscillospiraceae bacterium]|nr:type II toxin-antitoxin system PemK/MazF family toxin [Oscillospiraceae bacterium]